MIKRELLCSLYLGIKMNCPNDEKKRIEKIFNSLHKGLTKEHKKEIDEYANIIKCNKEKVISISHEVTQSINEKFDSLKKSN